ncbi:MAG: SDR family NAD(P)-dependent oxidoreductase [Alphaproteobacteria bacterium]
MTINFDGRVALITGAGKGLGRAYALLLAERGCKLVVNNRKHAGDGAQGSADRLVDEIAAKGGHAVANYDSVEDAGSGARMVQQSLDAFGRLDILINNAGVDQFAAFHKLALDDFRRIFEINFFGSVYVTHAAIPVMRKAGYGRIVFSSSSAGLFGLHGLSAYSASKAALLGFMQAINQEGASHNILANAIVPYAATQMTEKHLTPELIRLMAPEFVAPMVAYLVSQQCTTGGDAICAGFGRFCRAYNVQNDGIGVATLDRLTPETLAAEYAAIRDMSNAANYRMATDAFQAMASQARLKP